MIDSHLQEHVELVKDEYYGDVVDDDDGATVFADLHTLIIANMSTESLEGLRDAAFALAQQEFTEPYFARVLDDDSRLVLAFRAESLCFLGYALVVQRTVTYMDGEPTEERHLDQLAMTLDRRSNGLGTDLVDLVVQESESIRSHLTLYYPKSLRRLYASWSFYDSDPPVLADIMPPGGYICMRRDA